MDAIREEMVVTSLIYAMAPEATMEPPASCRNITLQ